MNDKPRTMNKGGRRSLFRFREWPVYQAAKSFRKKIRELTRGLPDTERFLLKDQASRAADSICLNIAEGSNKLSDVEFSRYLNNAEASLEEVVSCLDLLLDDGRIKRDVFEAYIREAEDLGAQLIAFGKKVRREGTRL
ncbi:MAG: four helix bundle protein [Proteobacteria bacterium]|nr:four helix bundle protein [Pseudomonadota bacterium]